jgi:drug/metabolite transporter (DMT)-like permease
MSTTSVALAIITIVGMTAGQLLFKTASQQGSAVQIITSLSFWTATCLYGVVTIAWVLLLREMGLARAYPIMAVTYVLVPLASFAILGERVGPLYLLGIAMISGGIILTRFE